MASSLQQMAATITERSKTLINNDLKKILKEEGTAQSGNKAALQARVIGRPMYFFKESPFFEVRDLVLSNMSLIVSPTHRNSINKQLSLDETNSARLRSDPSLRLLLFSAVEQPLSPFSRPDIAFPSQIEVKINDEEVKANYKGLKNKPGSTRPADLTDFVRFKVANQRNNLHITYALTQKAIPQKYNLFIYLVKKFSVEELTKRIKHRNVITRQSVLNEMVKKANDPDIEVGSSVMSLKDPISTVRISTPCRSTVCTHNQCFDAESFLQLQEQAPTWMCPICNKTISYEALAVDQYVEEILNKARHTDQVTIQPNGEWSMEKDAPSQHNGHAHAEDSEDDLVEISDYRVRAIKSEAAPTPTSLSTPPLPSRETSTAPRSGNKRTYEVVDLTLSDDEEPVRPAKKVAYTTPNSIPDPSRRYQFPPPSGNSAVHSRPPPPGYQRNMSAGTRSELSRPPSTPPPRHGYHAYRPAQPPPRPNYPGQGTSSYPTYLSSSP
ncbi:zf-MIZ-domain-containing protein [Decorospora gaudefroyi]|uniref:Zf-MIZ-domain-containing protein n=1 Tax=Decorospora gaudefroyi TaxID=184978 RepID=A0A6A5KE67_9PLEO|nr:zf-MIZ-domain-containing protein [Decorospora gaudefroyi]